MILTTCKYFDLVGNRCSRVTDGKCNDLQDCEFKYIAELKAENERLKKDKIGLHSEIKQLEQENFDLKENFGGQRNAYKKLNSMYEENLKLCKWQEQQINSLATAIEKIAKLVEGTYEALDPQALQGIRQIIKEQTNEK